MVKRFLVALAVLFTLSGAQTYQIIPLDNINSHSFAALITGLTPGALTATLGIQSQSVTFNGLVHVTDGAIGWNLLAGQNANCPLVSVRIPSDNTFAFDFLNVSANACTPNAGTYVIVVMRVP
jgi:hypothetical protein